jgi:transcriptional regulator with XRE-family HTH domain
MAIRGATTTTKGFQDDRYRAVVELLVAERKRQRMSQEKLARILGLHQPFVSRFENGERRLDIIEFIDVAKALGLRPEGIVKDAAKS